MPWNIVEHDDRCSRSNPWAVVKASDNALAGCHATWQDAQDQLAALNASEGGRQEMPEFTRTFEPDLEIRSAAQGGDGRTIVGLAVPYGQAQRIDERLVEQFARGAFNAQIRSARRVPFARDHLPMGGTLIGRATLLRDDPAGLYGEWRVSATPAGDETLELVRDGALSHLSIGFREGQNRRMKDGTIERISAELREVAVVMEGAYGELATVGGIRATYEHEFADRLGQARQILAKLPELPAPL